MFSRNFLFRLYRSPDPDTGGGGTDAAVADRGNDVLEPPDKSGEGAAGEAAAAAALEAELTKGDKGDAASEAAETAEQKEAKKDTRIPLERHTKILERERETRAALERELKRYQGGEQVATLDADITAAETSLSGMERDYNKFVADGEMDKATELMAKIRKTERGIVEAKSDMKLQAGLARAAEAARYNVAVERIEAQYPQLNPDSPEYDPEVAAEVLEMTRGYQAQNYTPTEAMQKAVRKELGAKTTAQEKAVSVAPRVTPKDAAQARKEEALTKTAAAVEKTPPSTVKVGANSDKMGGVLDAGKVAAMNQKEFAKLPDDVLSKLRGDEV